MSKLRKVFIAGLVCLLLIQFVQPALNNSEQVFSTDVTKTVQVPNAVLALLRNACYDCHSNNTRYPWYVYVQPMGWAWQSTLGWESRN